MAGRVQGTVRAQSTRLPIADLVVEIREVGAEGSPNDLPGGHSLGRSRTRPDGRFSVALDDPGPEAKGRRRIVAAVFADDNAGAGGQGGGNGDGDARRPLAVTRPQLEPIDLDDLVVSLPDGVLQDNGIEPRPPVVHLPKSQGQAAAARLQLAESTKRSLQAATSAETARRLALRRQGRSLGRRLLAKKGKRALEGRRAYVPPGAPAEQQLTQAKAEGVRRLETLQPPGMTVHVGLAQARVLFPDGPSLEPVPLPIDLIDLIPTTTGASRLADLLTACRAEHLAEVLGTSRPHDHGPDHGEPDDEAGDDGLDDDEPVEDEGPGGGTAQDGDDTPPDKPTPGTIPRGPRRRRRNAMALAAGRPGALAVRTSEALVARRPGAPVEEAPAAPVDGQPRPDLLHQLAAVLSSRPGTDILPRPNAAAIGQDLATNLPPGPADTTAFYDFHHLQVAWEDTWTSAMDGMTVSAVSDLYESLVDTVDPQTLPTDDSEIGELEDLLQSVADAIAVSAGVPGLSAPAELLTWFPGVAAAWTSLSPDDQEWVRFLQWVDQYVAPVASTFIFLGMESAADLGSMIESSPWPDDWFESVQLQDLVDDPDWGLHQAEDFVRSMDTDDPAPPPSGLARLERVLGGLNARLAEPHQFDIFVPNSYNYGLLTTYRQRWQPLEYQVGDLVGSLPLSPGETRTFETKRVVKTTRTQKEIEHSTASRTGESTTTGRVESEIVQKASHATNFAMAAEGSFQIGIVDIGASSSFGADQAADSAETKRNLRESTVRAAQEYRDERTLEVVTEHSTTGETLEKRTITNPNNELTVTYLLYELQRRFEISEQLHEVRPVVLVAFDVPTPDEITEGWLIANAWILRRVILDDRLLPALDYLVESFAGDELGVEILRAQWDAQMRAVDALRDNLQTSASVRDVARAALVAAASSVSSGDGLVRTIGEILFPPLALVPSGGDQEATITAQRESAQQGLEWADSDLLEQRARVEVSISALQQATDAYVHNLKQRTNRRVAIDQLRVHVKENVLHYMQAIWSHEPTDQRYFRLYDLPIEWPQTDAGSYTMQLFDRDLLSTVGGVAPARSLGNHAQELAPGIAAPTPPPSLSQGFPRGTLVVHTPPPRLGPKRPLHEVADVDALLGFKGNYAMFPLREGNTITEYMAQAFLDSYFGVIDPDPFGQVPTTSQAIELAECAWDREGTTDADRAEITEWLLAVLAAQGRISEEIIVPTGQLFMEALPGSHPLLEDFKLRHRQLDLERAAVDVKVRQVELLRRAARLVDGDFSDPDIEQRIEVSGTEPTIDLDLPAPAADAPVVEPA